MEKTKIFSGTLTTDEKLIDLEQNVNSWLKENKNIKITSRTSSVCTGTNVLGEHVINCTIVVFYYHYDE